MPAGNAMAAEIERIAASEMFRKSPILVKLLTYLGRETLAGRGNLLKSYTVAVDGLGRSADFDAQGDSYPRVQVGRLRKLLEAYYAKPGNAHDPCIHIPLGTYQLELIARTELGAGFDQMAPTHDPHNSLKRLGDDRPGWFNRLRKSGSRLGTLWKIAALVIGVAALTAALLSLRPSPAKAVPRVNSAILMIMPMEHEGDPRSGSLARDASAQFIDGLSHSWVARVRTSTASLPKSDNGHVYRLETQLGSSDQGPRPLYARLFDQAGATLVWSKELSLPADASEARLTIDSVIAELSGSYGVIARNEASRLRGSFAPGYACELQYFRYVAVRNRDARGKLDQCLAQPSPEERLEGMRQATLAMMVLDVAPAANANRQIRLAQAFEQAQSAAEDFPLDYFTHFALARLAYSRSDCSTGFRQTKLTLNGNNNDPLVLGVLSALTYFCGMPDTLGLADRTYRFQIDGDSSARITTILVAIATKRRDRLEVLANFPMPQTAENSAYTNLCNTLLFAALDRRDDAIRSWQAYRMDFGGGTRSDDEMIGEYIVADLTRTRVLAFLRLKGVIT
jgi:hypothetical protein